MYISAGSVHLVTRRNRKTQKEEIEKERKKEQEKRQA